MMNQNIQSLSNWSKMASCSAMAVGVCMTYVASQALQCCNERTAKCALMAISSSRVLQVGVALSAASILLLYKSDSQIHQAQVALERLNTMKEGALTTLRNGLEAAERLHAAQSEKVKAL
ncbi:MAG: hypothetical protein FJZ58_07565, partial [Chlamydiae bacterium]|nr:hypothetical protein [Chlamydiota bacterium]